MAQAINPSLPDGSGSDTVYSMIAQIMEARRLRVHRLLTRQIASDKYLVGRVGVRGAITTSELGVAAIRLLRKGSSPRSSFQFGHAQTVGLADSRFGLRTGASCRSGQGAGPGGERGAR